MTFLEIVLAIIVGSIIVCLLPFIMFGIFASLMFGLACILELLGKKPKPILAEDDDE